MDNTSKIVNLFTLDTGKLIVFRLAFFMFIISFLDIFGLSIIYPILSVFLNPEKVMESKAVGSLYLYFHLTSPSQLINILLFITVIVFFSKYFFSLFVNKVKYATIYEGQIKLANVIFNRYLHADYHFFSQHSPVSLVERINVDLQLAFNQVFVNVLVFLSDFFLVGVFLIAVALLRPAIFAVIIIAMAIIAIFATVAKRLPLSVERSHNKKSKSSYSDLQNHMAQIVEESISNFKFTKTRRMESIYVEKFFEKSNQYKDVYIKFRRDQDRPKSNLEFFFGLAICLTLFIFSVLKINVINIIPLLSVFLLALFRLIPALNRMILSFATINFYMPSVDNLMPLVFTDSSGHSREPSRETSPFEKIEVRNVSHNYDQHVVLRDINLEIVPGDQVYLIGRTGSGKSTFLNILIGLLQPACGSVLLNDKPVEKLYESISHLLFYIPQSLYFPNFSIAKIVANYSDIEEKRVHHCLKVACFNLNSGSFEDGINTRVGVNGARLSGGERQRLAIARALYAKPKILVLDEATSAIDDNTQEALMRNLRLYHPEVTTVAVTHRYNSIKKDDKVYEIVEGKLVERKLASVNHN